MKIDLPRDLERFVEDQIRLGQYASVSDLVGEALRQLKERSELIRELEEKIDRGLEDAAAGRVHTPEEVRTYLRQRRADRAASHD